MVREFFEEFDFDMGLRLWAASMKRADDEEGEAYRWYQFTWNNVYEFGEFMKDFAMTMSKNKNFRRLLVVAGPFDPPYSYSIDIAIPKTMWKRYCMGQKMRLTKACGGGKRDSE